MEVHKMFKQSVGLLMMIGLFFVFSGSAKASTGSIIDTFMDESMLALTTDLNVNTISGYIDVETSGTAQTITLRPNGVGSETSIPNCSPSGSAHWQCVDEVSQDGTSSYIYYPGSSATTKRDLYSLSDPAVSGTISNLTHYHVGRNNNSYSQAAIYTYGSNYNGPAVGSGIGWTLFSYSWVNNPFTLNTWTWDEIDSLEAGVNINCGNKINSPDWADVTQVYVTVTYYPYKSSGALWSTNLLSELDVTSIDSFGYNASSIPTGASLRVQFSQDNSNWYNSAGLLSGWDTLLIGDNNVDLSLLGWSGENFYYQMEFYSNVANGTPVLDEIRVNYSSGVIPEPASLLLLGFGVVGLVGFGRLKKKG